MTLLAPRLVQSLRNPLQQAVQTALENHIEHQPKVTPAGQLQKLQQTAVEKRHNAIGADDAEIRRELLEQIHPR